MRILLSKDDAEIAAFLRGGQQELVKTMGDLEWNVQKHFMKLSRQKRA